LTIFASVIEELNSKYCSCLYYSANALARIMSKMADEEFSITGLAPSYAFLLMTVNWNPGIFIKEISRQMQLTPSTVTRLIEKMEVKGYLKRIAEGKFTKVFPTAKSKKLDKKIKSAWQKLYKRYSELLGEKNAKTITDQVYSAAKKLEERYF
jgi:DNA-binding MarR family transcriptional regulator